MVGKKLKFLTWIKKEMAENGGLDNVVICHSDGSLEYTGEEELEKFISENIVNIRELKEGDYRWRICNINNGEVILVDVV